jgi:hypothetical protein
MFVRPKMEQLKIRIKIVTEGIRSDLKKTTYLMNYNSQGCNYLWIKDLIEDESSCTISRADILEPTFTKLSIIMGIWSIAAGLFRIYQVLKSLTY